MGRVAAAESLCLPPLPMLTTSQTEDAGRERRGARVTFSSAFAEEDVFHVVVSGWAATRRVVGAEECSGDA